MNISMPNRFCKRILGKSENQSSFVISCTSASSDSRVGTHINQKQSIIVAVSIFSVGEGRFKEVKVVKFEEGVLLDLNKFAENRFVGCTVKNVFCSMRILPFVENSNQQ